MTKVWHIITIQSSGLSQRECHCEDCSGTQVSQVSKIASSELVFLHSRPPNEDKMIF